MYVVWEKGWFGRSLEEMNAIVAPFRYQPQEKEFLCAIENKEKFTNRLLYKFCGVPSDAKHARSHYLSNLENDLLYLARPRELNDPSETCYSFDIERFLMENYGYSRRRDPEGIIPGILQMSFGSFGEPITPNAIEKLKPIFQKLPQTLKTKDEKMQSASEIKSLMAQDGNEVLFYHFLSRKLTFDDFIAFSYLLLDDPRLFRWAKSYGIQEKNDKAIILDQIFSFFEELLFANDEAKAALLICAQLGGNTKTNEIIENFDSFKTVRENLMKRWKKEGVGPIGIASLSEDYDNPLMWSHYSNRFRGFCLEYDLTNPLSGKTEDIEYARARLVPISYSDEKPKVYPNQGSTANIKIKDALSVLAGKSRGWSYENEWRIIGNENEHSRKLIIRPKAILLGINASKKTKMLILNIAQRKGIPVYTTWLDPQNYHIHKNWCPIQK